MHDAKEDSLESKIFLTYPVECPKGMCPHYIFFVVPFNTPITSLIENLLQSSEETDIDINPDGDNKTLMTIIRTNDDLPFNELRDIAEELAASLKDFGADFQLHPVNWREIEKLAGINPTSRTIH